MVEKLTSKEKKEIRELFDGLDTDGSGSLSTNEVRTGLFNLGRLPTQKDMDELLEELGMKKGQVKFEQFEKCMAKYFLAHTDPKKELEDAFAVFDKDKSGSVDIKELTSALTTLGEKLTKKEVEILFKDVDIDKNGKLDYKEMTAYLSSNKSKKRSK